MSKQQTLLLTISFVFLLLFTSKAFGNIIISGVYQGQNLRISNPINEDGIGFSTIKIVVNGKIVPLKFDLSEAEIDFTRLGLLPGTKIEIVISYENSSTPIIFNPDAISELSLINTLESQSPEIEPINDELAPNDRNHSKY
ncbi:MAG: hypothetical protein A3D31_00130 [Candidatus Fluviicola riflensis]|nr:MAG: hypothetical protein CHH17_05415 [Candidatus Fluviicola riflensis]OGS76018.1 MAG: hypothetical protein A3D31_00130 [Candidatus Fluviicola riflensis]OGS81918.1 MAG: hypothetical protein A2724_15885 [Fluviicola sp. RIFCSPHIGHO2_01_FULL_43_53]OGS83356.1 MAG: hypothetical protein A3E30_19050 [Fluviicola sp. RIFCSPHIGHO2_12_FULL_43_24]